MVYNLYIFWISFGSSDMFDLSITEKTYSVEKRPVIAIKINVYMQPSNRIVYNNTKRQVLFSKRESKKQTKSINELNVN